MDADRSSRREFIKKAAAIAAAPVLLTAVSRSVSADPPATLPVTGSAATAAAPIKARSFEFHGVRLLDGPMKVRFEATRDYYFRVPDDDILKGFRRRAGLAAPGNDMGGWANKNSEIVFGQWLSGMSRYAAGSNDTPMRDKAVHLMTEFGKTMGRFGCGHYGFEKFICGFTDVATFTGEKSGLPTLEKITKWGQRHLGRKRVNATDADSQGGFFNGELEWYTLPENLYRAYMVTGDTLYRDFARDWHYPAYWDMFDGKSPAAPHGFHAYSHCNALNSLAMAYAVTGDGGLLTRLINAHDYFVDTQCYVTGGYGPGEKLMTPDGALGESITVEPNAKYLGNNIGRSFETPCGTWAIFKLCDSLIQFTGQSRFGDWMERALYNGIGAALPMSGRGTTFYYADYRMKGSARQYYKDAWPCCAGTFIQDVSQYVNLIYYNDSQGLLVNLFVPSEVTWKQSGRDVTVVQRTEYPSSERTDFEIRTDAPIEFSLRLRIPAWSEGVSIHLNGQPLKTPITAGEWATVRRTWASGDKLSMRIPLTPRLVAIDKQHPGRVAAACGPVALVRVNDVEPIANAKAFGNWSASNGKPLELSSTDKAAGQFLPFFKAEKGQPYHMYFDLTETA